MAVGACGTVVDDVAFDGSVQRVADAERVAAHVGGQE